MKTSTKQLTEEQQDKIIQLEIDICELTIFTLNKIMPEARKEVKLFYKVIIASNNAASMILNHNKISTRSLEENFSDFMEMVNKKIHSKETKMIEVKV